MKKLITLLFVLTSFLGYSQSPKDTIGDKGLNVHLLDSLVEVYVNQERADRGIQPLIINEERKSHSYKHSQWMVENNKFEHSEGVSENIIMSYIYHKKTYEQAAKSIVDRWFDSSPHKKAFLSVVFKFGGCGSDYTYEDSFYTIRSSFGLMAWEK